METKLANIFVLPPGYGVFKLIYSCLAKGFSFEPKNNYNFSPFKVFIVSYIRKHVKHVIDLQPKYGIILIINIM